MMCRGSAIHITQNLFDALCVNQQDNKEKSGQIPLMKYIYRYAKRVIIWLGPSDGFTGKALALVDRAAESLRQEIRQHVPLAKDIRPERMDLAMNHRRGFPPVDVAAE
jgi:hypothetical protein